MVVGCKWKDDGSKSEQAIYRENKIGRPSLPSPKTKSGLRLENRPKGKRVLRSSPVVFIGAEAQSHMDYKHSFEFEATKFAVRLCVSGQSRVELQRVVISKLP